MDTIDPSLTPDQAWPMQRSCAMPAAIEPMRTGGIYTVRIEGHSEPVDMRAVLLERAMCAGDGMALVAIRHPAAEYEALARLIAAAPQQHDALVAASLSPAFNQLDDATRNAVLAAIAAAGGTQ